ncbi:Na+/H+-dicarboxylate symporter [Plasticicumulans lactativorans]|uniref:Na+/H+-dicarboxylate symporter n=1 Tax=Plasticicumulans lactativorans TaxID=1133106 RepID=A0A4R2LA17_9GAMM|nr:dicarboxylate/amino acid:cation symporter [Plasticicumulans lactativorans]TCO81129.1 Na+/H+-dicarboxylate symporter [Plasticicumulans lactativorans]
MRSNKLTSYILVAMVLGVITGQAVRELVPDPEWVKSFAANISLLTEIFLRLIKMIIAPLVFTTLVVGIAKMDDIGTVGRIGAKTLLWFVGASAVSITLGMLLVNLFQPGVASGLTLPDAGAVTGLQKSALSLKEFVAHLVPKSVIEAMATNEILQIVVFAVFFGLAAAALGQRTRALIADLDMLAHIMLKVTTFVMNFSPIAVFAAMAAIVARQGLGVLATYGKFIGEFYIGIALLLILLVAAASLVLGRRVLRLVKYLREPTLLAFSTASSEAAFPKTLEQLERFGCSNKVASFVLPMGYSFNLDGSMMFCAFASMFVAQVYGVDMSIGSQVALALTLMITSKGIAGVPRASLVVVAATLPSVGIPEAGLLLLIGIDQFFDMGRTAVNVIGNGIATAVVSKWEGDLQPHAHAEPAAPAKPGAGAGEAPVAEPAVS